MAQALPADGRLTTLEFDATHAKIAAAHIAASPHAAQVTVVPCNAHAWLAREPLAPTYHLVFIDAEKTGYADYLDAVLPRMHPRSWILGDNSLLFGAMSGENPDGASAAAKKSMTRFNETLADASRFESILLPTVEGLTVARLR
jgi:caffeoyl-CoA O-methyltransferase